MACKICGDTITPDGQKCSPCATASVRAWKEAQTLPIDERMKRERQHQTRVTPADPDQGQLV